MRNQYTVARPFGGAGWSRNQNLVRHEKKTFGPIATFGIFAMLVVVVGLIYVSQGARAADYDYELSKVEAEISDLKARRESLAFERARLTSIAASAASRVAMTMEEAKPAGFVEE